MASRLTTSAAHLTVTRRGPGHRGPADDAGDGSRDEGSRAAFDDAAAAEFAAIDEALATIRVPYDEWEVLYRQRLQVERDLRAGAMAGEAVLGAETPGVDGPSEALAPSPGSCAAARRRSSTLRPTTRPSTPSTSSPDRAGGLPRRLPTWLSWPLGRQSVSGMPTKPARAQQRASRHRSVRPAREKDGDDSADPDDAADANGTTGR